jgi:hypothetical protein
MRILPLTQDNLIAVRVSAILTTEELDHFEAMIKHVIARYGEVRLYFEMEQFNGWEPESFLENAFFELVHAHQFAKVAMVGEKNWQAWLARLVNVVKRGQVRYFGLDQRVQALEWIQYGSLRTTEERS